MGNRAVKACSLRSCAYCIDCDIDLDGTRYCGRLPRHLPDSIVDRLNCPVWCPDLTAAERQTLGVTCGECVTP